MNAANIKEVKVVEEKKVEFIHTSWMTDPETEVFHFIDGKWRNVNPQSPWANITFKENSIPEVEWWS